MSQLDDHTLAVKGLALLMHESAAVAFWRPEGAEYHIGRIVCFYDNMRESIEYLREHIESSKE